MTSIQKVALVIGGTGNMGKEVVRHLHHSNPGKWIIRVLTRNPLGEGASNLSELVSGLELVVGTVTNEQDLRSALDGVDVVFCNTDYWSLWSENGESIEAAVGSTILRLARESGVTHFVYSAADSTDSLSAWELSVSHFDAKAQVAHRIREGRYAGDMWFRKSVSILTTAPYYENFLSFFRPTYDAVAEELLFALPVGDARWTMVALSDIGWFAARMLSDRDYWGGRDLAIASDSLTIMDISAIFSQVTGLKSRGVALSDDLYLSLAGDMGRELLPMFKFVRKYGLWRDFKSLREIHPKMLRFGDWVATVNWREELCNEIKT